MSDVVVVGAGHSGLAVSWHLRHRGIEHVVLERGRVAESWRTQRWDSFALNTPSWFSRLPGEEVGPAGEDGFAVRDDLVRHWEAYADHERLPVRTGVTVTSVRPIAGSGGGGGFVVETDAMGPLRARAVVAASGAQNVGLVPAVAAGLPSDVHVLHASAYRGPANLPSGAVLVVGSAQSGVQIAEDLLGAGRTVHLATGRVGRARRRYRGRDFFFWGTAAGFFDQAVAQLPDPAMAGWPQPQISGVGPLGHSVSLQWLGERGVLLLGRLDGVHGGRLTFRDDLGANIAWGDESSARTVQLMEQGIAASGLEAGSVEPDPADVPHPDPVAVHSPASVDLVTAGISTVIWATGVSGDFSWLPGAALTANGQPRHDAGITPVRGLSVLGLPWQRNRSSGVIRGADADAALIAARIADELAAA